MTRKNSTSRRPQAAKPARSDRFITILQLDEDLVPRLVQIDRMLWDSENQRFVAPQNAGDDATASVAEHTTTTLFDL